MFPPLYIIQLICSNIVIPDQFAVHIQDKITLPLNVYCKHYSGIKYMILHL